MRPAELRTLSWGATCVPSGARLASRARLVRARGEPGLL